MNFIHEMDLSLAWSKDAKYLLRIDCTNNHLLTYANFLAFFDLKFLTSCNWISNRFATIIWCHDDLLTLCIFKE